MILLKSFSKIYKTTLLSILIMAECKRCGDCCRYVTVIIDTPEEKIDWEEVKWWVCHKNVIVYYDKEDDEWAVEFRTPCKYQDENNNCTIYEKRPQICSDHDSDECETNADGDCYDILFEEPADVDRYLEENPHMLKESSEDDEEESEDQDEEQISDDDTIE